MQNNREAYQKIQRLKKIQRQKEIQSQESERDTDKEIDTKTKMKRYRDRNTERQRDIREID